MCQIKEDTCLVFVLRTGSLHLRVMLLFTVTANAPFHSTHT